MADDHHATPPRTDFTVHKGEVSLAVYRKHVGPAPGQPPCPVLFLVHGSSNSALSSFDLTVPGAGECSTMNVFAGLGFDVWTMDHENYGRSSRTSGNSDIASGVEGLIAASELVIGETGPPRMHFMGETSGALRGAAFAMRSFPPVSQRYRGRPRRSAIRFDFFGAQRVQVATDCPFDPEA